MTRLARKIVFFLFCAGACASAAYSATWYVDASCGNNGNGQADQCASTSGGAGAFTSLQSCVDNMNGGDTCLVKNGTYYRAGAQGYIPGFNFCVNGGRLNGTAGQYTTIKAYPGHTPKICADASCSANPASPAIGVFQDSGFTPSCGYVAIQGFEVSGAIEVRAPWGTAAANGVHHVEVSGNNVHGGFDCDGNYSMLRLECVNHVYVHNNYIHDMDDGGGCGFNSSAAGIKMFVTSDMRIEYNTVVGNSYLKFGIDDKDASARNKHLYNRVSNAAYAGFRLNAQTASFAETPTASEIAGNLIVGAATGINPMMDISYPNIHHNTIVVTGTDTCIGFYFGSTNSNPVTYATVRDNICQSAGDNFDVTVNSWGSRSGYTIDYNRYTSSANYRGDQYGSGDTTYTDLATWRTATGKEANSSEVSSPVCSWLDTTDYKITAATACKTASSSGGEVGVYGIASCVGSACSTDSPIVVNSSSVVRGVSAKGAKLK